MVSLMISFFAGCDVGGGSSAFLVLFFFFFYPVPPGKRQLPIEPSTGLELSVLWRTCAAFTLLKIQGRPGETLDFVAAPSVHPP